MVVVVLYISEKWILNGGVNGRCEKNKKKESKIRAGKEGRRSVRWETMHRENWHELLFLFVVLCWQVTCPQRGSEWLTSVGCAACSITLSSESRLVLIPSLWSQMRFSIVRRPPNYVLPQREKGWIIVNMPFSFLVSVPRGGLGWAKQKSFLCSFFFSLDFPIVILLGGSFRPFLFVLRMPPLSMSSRSALNKKKSFTSQTPT